jgi:hypothetical protein
VRRGCKKRSEFCPDGRVRHRLDLNEPRRLHCPDDMWQRLRLGD